MNTWGTHRALMNRIAIRQFRIYTAIIFTSGLIVGALVIYFLK